MLQVASTHVTTLAGLDREVAETAHNGNRTIPGKARAKLVDDCVEGTSLVELRFAVTPDSTELAVLLPLLTDWKMNWFDEAVGVEPHISLDIFQVHVTKSHTGIILKSVLHPH